MGRVERGVWSVERGAWRVERGAWSVECGAWSVECGVWSGVEWSVEWSGVEWSGVTQQNRQQHQHVAWYVMDRLNHIHKTTTRLEHGKIFDTFLQLMNCSSQGGYVMIFYDKRMETEDQPHMASVTSSTP